MITAALGTSLHGGLRTVLALLEQREVCAGTLFLDHFLCRAARTSVVCLCHWHILLLPGKAAPADLKMQEEGCYFSLEQVLPCSLKGAGEGLPTVFTAHLGLWGSFFMKHTGTGKIKLAL